MNPTTTRKVKELLHGNRFRLNARQTKEYVVQTVLNGLPAPDEGMTLIVLSGCSRLVLPPDQEVLVSMAGMNIGAPMKDVRHADLKRIGDSQHKSECPACGDGVLTMHRSPSTMKLQNSDRCTLCGQAFWYTDLPNDVLSNASEMDILKN